MTKKRRNRKAKARKSECIKREREHPDFGAMSLDDAVGGGQTRKHIVNWYTVQGWFWREIVLVDKKWLVAGKHESEKKQTWWTWREKGCAERLLKLYGPEVVEKVVKWFVKNWQAMKDRSDGKLTGAPTVNLLWVSRERIVPDAIAGVEIELHGKGKKKGKRKRQNIGEYNDESAKKLPRVGWGDV